MAGHMQNVIAGRGMFAQFPDVALDHFPFGFIGIWSCADLALHRTWRQRSTMAQKFRMLKQRYAQLLQRRKRFVHNLI